MTECGFSIPEKNVAEVVNVSPRLFFDTDSISRLENDSLLTQNLEKSSIDPPSPSEAAVDVVASGRENSEKDVNKVEEIRATEENENVLQNSDIQVQEAKKLANEYLKNQEILSENSDDRIANTSTENENIETKTFAASEVNDKFPSLADELELPLATFKDQSEHDQPTFIHDHPTHPPSVHDHIRKLSHLSQISMNDSIEKSKNSENIFYNNSDPIFDPPIKNTYFEKELDSISEDHDSVANQMYDTPKNGPKSDSLTSSRTSLTSSICSSQALNHGGLNTFGLRLGSAPLPRIVEWLKISIAQLKFVNKSEENSQTRMSVQVKFDNQDVFQTAMVPCTSSCVIGDEFVHELKPGVTSVRLYITEHLPDSKSRPIGRAFIRRKDAVQAAAQDNWYTVYGVSGGGKSSTSTVFGEILLDITYDLATNVMKLRILHFTAQSNANDPLKSPNGHFYLGFRVAGHGEFTSMEKLKISSSERISLQTVQIDCSGFSERVREARARQLSVDSVTSEYTTQSIHSLTLTPGTPCSAHRPTPTSSSGSSSTIFEDSPLRLSIKVYKEPKNEASCCGHVRIPLDDDTMLPKNKAAGPNWYEVKSKMTVASITSSTTTSTVDQKRNFNSTTSVCDSRASTSTPLTKSNTKNSEKIGDMRLRIWHSIDQILPFIHYQPLYSNLMQSLSMQPQSASLTSLLQCLPIELENLAKPLMRIYFHSSQIRAFFRNICSQYVASCHDVNTLFRSQSMASKVLHELMMFVGHSYLVLSLKPLIDLICVERKCCEIDPAKLKPGDSLEQNMRNLMVYAELAFSQVVGSRSRCPKALREIFADLRDIVAQFYPRRVEVSRLALSSFLIMRFFAPAILNPKLIDRKRPPPDGDVQRTLVLISKILQRLANCVVSTNPLTQKEEWLTPVLTRFSDDRHKSAMIDFLDSVSAPGGETPPTSKESGCLKEGPMVERRSGTERRRSIKNLIHQKRRYVTLTEKELTWQKAPKDVSGDVETKGAFPLDEITSVSVLTDAKHSFRVATQKNEVHFQANSQAEMNEWIILIQKQQRRQAMLLNRSAIGQMNEILELADIDVELELETIHCILMENRDTLVHWLAALNGDENTPRFPEELMKTMGKNEEKKLFMETLHTTIEQTLDAIDKVEGAHKTAMNLQLQFKNFQPQKPGDHPLTDNENYLLMRGDRKRRKQFN